MKRIGLMLAIVAIVLFLSSCNYKNEYEKKAEEFINLYYAQYEKKSEIEEIFNFNEDIISDETDALIYGIHDGIFDKKVEEFFDRNFGEILTKDEKLRLISNRVIPKADVINSDIIKAIVSSIEFDEINNQNEGTLSFSAIIINEHIDGENTKSEKSGIIRLVKDGDNLKVDYFKFN